MRLEKAQHEAGADAAGGSGLPSRLLVVLFAAAMTVTPPAAVLARQSAQTPGRQQGAAANAQARTETAASRPGTARPADAGAIRPFRVQVPREALDDLRRRIAATRWPERETVKDASQGVPLATIQALARYWATDYDWRRAEAKLNALPQFVTEIGGELGRASWRGRG